MNIGDCAAASYSTLTTSAATKILMFSSEKETLQFISQYILMNFSYYIR
jgi:hypothetical protein